MLDCVLRFFWIEFWSDQCWAALIIVVNSSWILMEVILIEQAGLREP